MNESPRQQLSLIVTSFTAGFPLALEIADGSAC